MMKSLLRQIWLMTLTRKKYWLLPLIIIGVVIGSFVIVSEGSAVAPFLYAIF